LFSEKRGERLGVPPFFVSDFFVSGIGKREFPGAEEIIKGCEAMGLGSGKR
jgi:hypothetical protein